MGQEALEKFLDTFSARVGDVSGPQRYRAFLEHCVAELWPDATREELSGLAEQALYALHTLGETPDMSLPPMRQTALPSEKSSARVAPPPVPYGDSFPLYPAALDDLNRHRETHRITFSDIQQATGLRYRSVTDALNNVTHHSGTINKIATALGWGEEQRDQLELARQLYVAEMLERKRPPIDREVAPMLVPANPTWQEILYALPAHIAEEHPTDASFARRAHMTPVRLFDIRHGKIRGTTEDRVAIATAAGVEIGLAALRPAQGITRRANELRALMGAFFRRNPSVGLSEADTKGGGPALLDEHTLAVLVGRSAHWPQAADNGSIHIGRRRGNRFPEMGMGPGIVARFRAVLGFYLYEHDISLRYFALASGADEKGVRRFLDSQWLPSEITFARLIAGVSMPEAEQRAALAELHDLRSGAFRRDLPKVDPRNVPGISRHEPYLSLDNFFIEFDNWCRANDISKEQLYEQRVGITTRFGNRHNVSGLRNLAGAMKLARLEPLERRYELFDLWISEANQPIPQALDTEDPIAALIYETRHIRGLSGHELLRLLRVPLSDSITLYEQGQRSPKLMQVINTLRVLSPDLDEFAESALPWLNNQVPNWHELSPREVLTTIWQDRKQELKGRSLEKKWWTRPGSDSSLDLEKYREALFILGAPKPIANGVIALFARGHYYFEPDEWDQKVFWQTATSEESRSPEGHKIIELAKPWRQAEGLGGTLAALRIRQRKTRVEFCAWNGIEPAELSRLESDDPDVPHSVAVRAFHGLGITEPGIIAAIMSHTEQPNLSHAEVTEPASDVEVEESTADEVAELSKVPEADAPTVTLPIPIPDPFPNSVSDLGAYLGDRLAQYPVTELADEIGCEQERLREFLAPASGVRTVPTVGMFAGLLGLFDTTDTDTYEIFSTHMSGVLIEDRKQQSAASASKTRSASETEQSGPREPTGRSRWRDRTTSDLQVAAAPRVHARVPEEQLQPAPGSFGASFPPHTAIPPSRKTSPPTHT